MWIVIAIVLTGVIVIGMIAVPGIVVRRDEQRAQATDDLDTPITESEPSTVVTPDGARLHVVAAGHGRPLVFIHGLALTHDLWRYQFHDLCGQFRIIALDLRGHGGSTVGNAGIGPHIFADDLAAVLNHYDLHNAIIFGHSLGGTVLGQFCADHPDLVNERVGGLAFVGSFAAAIAGEGRFRERVSPLLIRTTARLLSNRKPVDETPTGAMAYLLARTPFGPAPQPGHVRFTLSLGVGTSPSVVHGATVANIDYDVRDALGAVNLPSLIIRGSHDRLCTARSAAQLEKALSRPELVVLDECGHLPMLEQRQHFNDLVIDFVARVAANI